MMLSRCALGNQHCRSQLLVSSEIGGVGPSFLPASYACLPQLPSLDPVVPYITRDPYNEAAVAPLKALPGAAERLKLFKADLLSEGRCGRGGPASQAWRIAGWFEATDEGDEAWALGV